MLHTATALVAVLSIAGNLGAAPDDALRIGTPGVPASASALGAHGRATLGSVSEKTGSYTYSHRIVVPPGRAGMEPALALTYSSNQPMYGDIAAGWSLNLPTIQREPGIDSQYDRHLPVGWTTTLTGTRLIPADLGSTRPTFRAWGDASFTRYTQVDADHWEARSLQGTVHRFVRLDATLMPERFVLDAIVDRFGNTVDYSWGTSTSSQGLVSHELTSIEYTFNAEQGRGSHARVQLEYGPMAECSGVATPLGAALEPRSSGAGYLRGARPLTALVTGVRTSVGGTWREVRRTSLTYAAQSCNGSKGAARLLATIQERATSPTGTVTSMPAATFTYGALGQLPTVQRTMEVPDRGGYLARGLAGGRPGHGGLGPMSRDWSEVQTMLLDLDGDGSQDFANTRNLCTSPPCHLPALCENEVGWNHRGQGFIGSSDWTHPSVWHSAHCHMSAQMQEAYGLPPGIGNGEYSAINAYRYVDFDGDGIVDLLSAIFAPTTGWANGSAAGPSPRAGRPHPNCDATVPNPSWVRCDAGTETPPRVAPRSVTEHRASQTYGGDYVWRLHKGLLNVGFDLDPIFIRSPIPLDVVGRDGWQNDVRNNHTKQYDLVDLDADGFLDAVWADRADGLRGWSVWRGDGEQFHEVANRGPFEWAVPREVPAIGSLHTVDIAGSTTSFIDRVLLDVNGDGRPDLVVQPADLKAAAVAYLNTGQGFAATSQPILAPGQQLESIMVAGAVAPDGLPYRQDRVFTARLVDLDGDGLLEYVTFQPAIGTGVRTGAGSVAIRRGMGTYSGGDAVAGISAGMALGSGYAARSFATHYNTSNFFIVNGDIVDLDGDGYPEVVGQSGYPTIETRNGAPVEVAAHYGQHEVRGRDPAAAPPGLLVRVDSGRDSYTTIQYASRTRPDVVRCQSDGFGTCGGLAKAPRWVVATTETVSAGRESAATTSFVYETPVLAADERGHRDFRGFATVRVRTPGHHGARPWIVHSFDYDLDHRGVPTLTLNLDAAGTLHSFTSTDYIVKDELALPSATKTAPYCRSRSGTEASQASACGAEDSRLVTEHAWEGVGPGGSMPWLVASTSETLHAASTSPGAARAAVPGPAPSLERRRTVSDQRLVASDSRYWLEQTDHWLFLRLPIGDVQVEHRYTVHDERGMPARVETWLSENEYAVERMEHDATGLLAWRQKPEQYRRDGEGAEHVTRFTYDPFHVHAVTTENELEQVTEVHRDLGTGAVVETKGPSAHARTVHTIDGFGRTLRVDENAESPGGGYAMLLASRASFVDALGVPAVIETATLERLGDEASAVGNVVTIDGTGLVIGATRSAADGVPSQPSTFLYTAGGLVTTATAPSPASDSQIVTYRRYYDGFGRETATERPDGTGVDTAYIADVETRTDKASAAVSTSLHHDALGRLVRLDEADGTSTRTTTYRYDAADRVAEVVDPEGATSLVGYDGGGRRVAVVRGDRAWRYQHDHNGNITAVVAPHGATDDPLAYTSSLVYDDLDRPTSRIQGARDLTATERAALGTGSASWLYDTGLHGTGRLASSTVATGGTGHLTRSHGYDLAGNRVRDEIAFSIWNGGFSDSRVVTRAFDASGDVTRTTFADGVGARPATTVRWTTDAVGRPSSVVRPRSATDADPPLLGAVSWNRADRLAGRVAMTAAYNDQTYSYDSLGRPTGTDVGQTFAVPFPPGGLLRSTVASQTQTYTDSDNVATMSTAVAGIDSTQLQSWTFGYDARHQLTSASGPSYAAAYGYTPAGRVGSVTVTGASDLARDVRYQYPPQDGTGDGDLLQQLNNAAGQPVATFTWDAAGNQRTKVQGATTTTYRYDGGDDLREVRTTGSGAAREVYWYGVDGERLLALRLDSAGTPKGLTLWFDETEVHYGANGAVLETRAEVDLAGPFARIVNGAGVQYSFHNHLGHLLAAVNESGQVVAGFTYSPFGELLRTTGTSAGSFRRRFNGVESDGASGLGYYGHRYYDPDTFTWTQADPFYRFAPDTAWASPRRTNLYAFALNNPLRYVDGDGLDGVFYLNINGTKYPMGFEDPYAVQVLEVVVVDGVMLILGGSDANAPTHTSVPRDRVSELEQSKNIAIAVVGGKVGGRVLGKLHAAAKTRWARWFAPDRAPGTPKVPGRGGGVIPCASFVPGTRVMTPDGERPIDDVAAGEAVLCASPGDAEAGTWSQCVVTASWRRDYEGRYVQVEVEGVLTTSTNDHPYWVVSGEELAQRPQPEHDVSDEATGPVAAGRWVDAEHLRAGDTVAVATGGLDVVAAVRHYDGRGSVHNLTAEPHHTYAVGAGVLVHNAPCYGTTPRGRFHTEHSAKRAGERGFSDEAIDTIVDNNRKGRVRQVDEHGDVTYRHTDARGNTVILNEEGGIVTVYSPRPGGDYIPRPARR